MQMSEPTDIGNLTEGLRELTVDKEVEVEAEEKHDKIKKEKDTQDDGYLSSASDENITNNVALKKEEESGLESKTTEPDLDDEEELKPLSFIPVPEPEPAIKFTSRGPVPIDQEGHRYTPYGRSQPGHINNQIAPNISHQV